MKKAGFVFLLLLIFVATTNAQSPLSKGSKQLNAGLGFSGWGIPVYVGMDFGVYQDITVGGELSYRSYNYYNYSFSIFGVSANSNYHFNSLLEIPSQWDVYGGLNLGYYIWSTPSGYNGTGSRLGLGAQVGGRYFFKNNFGVNLEFGGGNETSGGKIGVTYIF